MMGFISKVAQAGTKGKSLRTTIPEPVAYFLEVQKGDELEWQVDFKPGKRIVTITKCTIHEKEATIASRDQKANHQEKPAHAGFAEE
jgi:antitoxin component of MazEF toxin-antitoxin module